LAHLQLEVIVQQLEFVAESKGRVSLLEGSDVHELLVTHLLPDSRAHASWVLALEDGVVIGRVVFLEVPELSNERPVLPVFTLWLPKLPNFGDVAVVEAFGHFTRHAAAKGVDGMDFRDLFLVDCSFLETVDHPLVVRGRNVDLVFLELADGLLGDFVHLLGEGPEFLFGVLHLFVGLLDVVDVVGWDDVVRVVLYDPAVLQKLVWVLYFDVREVIGYAHCWPLRLGLLGLLLDNNRSRLSCSFRSFCGAA